MHSRAFHPEFDKVAQELKRMGVSLTLAKIDADREKEVQEPFKIDGYPTILLFLDGMKTMSIPYEYERKAKNLIQWLREWIIF